MSVVDWNATAAWVVVFITLIISILTPAISTYLNNCFQLKLKQMELDYSIKQEMDNKKFSVYEGFLQTVGEYLQYSSRENESTVGKYMYELYCYLPENHWELLDSLITQIDNSNWSEAQSTMQKLSKVLSAELQACEDNQENPYESTPRKRFSKN